MLSETDTPSVNKQGRDRIIICSVSIKQNWPFKTFVEFRRERNAYVTFWENVK